MPGLRADQRTVARAVRVCRALATPTRLSLLLHLARARRGRVASELAALVGVHPATLSHQLLRLEAEGIIEAQREGTFIRYRLSRSRLGREVRRVLRLLCGG